MPKLEMSPMERLGLFASEDDGVKSWDGGAEDPSGATEASGKRKSGRRRERAAQKEIRRAYYRKSLQWHPDRWAGMGMYQLAVQGAFELINEAYSALTGASAEAEGGAAGAEASAGSAGPVQAEEPIYA